ncbi:glycosyltransferase [bacterium]|nr:glycosyltransferase [bacterium]
MKILYITTSFANLTHTFITREVDQLRRQGLEIELLALRRSLIHLANETECDIAECRYIYPVNLAKLTWGLATMLFSRPGRLCMAIRAAFASRHDSLKERFRLLYQLSATMTCVRDVEAMAPDHIHAHLANPPGSYAMFLGLLTGIPYSITGHAADLYCKPVGNDTKIRLAAGMVAISEYNMRHYRELHPDLRKAEVIHCGVELDDFTFKARGSLPLPLRILAVGRAAEKKGFRHLLDALQILKERQIPYRCDLIGGGPLLDTLKQQQLDLSLDDLVIHGPLQQSEVKAMLGRAHVFTLPCVIASDGDIDGIPVSLMEAMACGCPVVSTHISGIPELIADGESGLLVPPENPLALADALERLSADPDLTARISKGGRLKVETEFNLAIEGQKLERFFTSLRD